MICLISLEAPSTTTIIRGGVAAKDGACGRGCSMLCVRHLPQCYLRRIGKWNDGDAVDYRPCVGHFRLPCCRVVDFGLVVGLRCGLQLMLLLLPLLHLPNVHHLAYCRSSCCCRCYCCCLDFGGVDNVDIWAAVWGFQVNSIAMDRCQDYHR